TVGPNLTVKVQDQYPSQTVTSAGTTGACYTHFSAIIYLQGVGSTFVTQPDAIVAHEFGAFWSNYYLFLAQQNDWTGYLQPRGLYGDSRLDSSYAWSKLEII